MICFGLLRPSFQKLELLGEQTWGLGVEGEVGGGRLGVPEKLQKMH